MSGQCCNNVHLSMDDTFIQWNEILGDPSTSTALNDFVDLKIRNVGGDIEKLIDEKFKEATSEIKEEIEKDIEKISLEIDPYKINYKDTTVGDALDKLNQSAFECKIQEFGTYEVGQNFPTFPVCWQLSENPKSLTIVRLRNCAPVERYKLDPSTRSFNFANVSGTETFKLIGVTQNGEEFEAYSTVEFKHRFYFGTYGATKPSNNVIINFSSEFIDKKTQIGRRIFSCEQGEYIYFAIPDDLHLTYDFFANGLKDNNWVYEVKNVTNQYGQVHPYRIYRTDNLLHGYNIYIEVESHDWY